MRPALFQQLRCVLRRLNAGPGHREVAQEGDIGLLQAKANLMLAEPVDAFNLLGQPEAVGVNKVRREGSVELGLGVDEAPEREQHIVHVHGPRGLEAGRAVELHALAELEMKHLGVGRHAPFGGQRCLQGSTAPLKAQQALEHLVVHIAGAGAVPQARVKALGAGVGAVHQRLGGARQQGKAEQGSACKALHTSEGRAKGRQVHEREIVCSANRTLASENRVAHNPPLCLAPSASWLAAKARDWLGG